MPLVNCRNLWALTGVELVINNIVLQFTILQKSSSSMKIITK